MRRGASLLRPLVTVALAASLLCLARPRAGEAVPALPVTISTPSVVPPASARPSCPASVTFTATIATRPFGARQESVIHYVWLRSDGHVGDLRTLRLKGPARQTVTDTWLVTSTQRQAWERIQTAIPYPARSAKATFDLTCRSG